MTAVTSTVLLEDLMLERGCVLRHGAATGGSEMRRGGKNEDSSTRPKFPVCVGARRLSHPNKNMK